MAEEGSSSTVAANESQEFMWISRDDDISRIDTFDNMKKILECAFSAASSMDLSKKAVQVNKGQHTWHSPW